MSMDDSFYEMTYSDTAARELHAARLANDRANFTLFMDKVSGDVYCRKVRGGTFCV